MRASRAFTDKLLRLHRYAEVPIGRRGPSAPYRDQNRRPLTLALKVGPCAGVGEPGLAQGPRLDMPGRRVLGPRLASPSHRGTHSPVGTELVAVVT